MTFAFFFHFFFQRIVEKFVVQVFWCLRSESNRPKGAKWTNLDQNELK